MRKITFFVTLLLLLAGCRQERAVSPRLVELDSLIAVDPDSAAALLQDYPADSLRDPDNRAYHALLTTQAKYKAYIPVYSLDTINIAASQYSDGHDPEKQTRSVLYKGCVFEDQQQFDSAMYYYKAAEDLANQSGDTYHCGYAVIRQAELFQNRYAKRDAIELFKKSLLHFRQINATYWQLNAALALANQYQTVNLDSSFYYIVQAMGYSQELDSIRYDDCLSTLASCYLLNEDYRSCITAAEASISCSTDRNVYFRSCNWAAQAYAKLGMKDSGTHYLNLAPSPLDKADSVLFLSTKATMSGKDSLIWNTQAGNMADSLIDIATVTSLKDAMTFYTSSQAKQAVERSSQRQNNLIFISIFTVTLLLLIMYLGKREYRHANYRLLKEINRKESEIRSKEKDIDSKSQIIQEKDLIIMENEELISRKEHEIMLKSALIERQQSEIRAKEDKIKDGSQLIQSQHETIVGKDETINSLLERIRMLCEQITKMRHDADLSEACNKTDTDSQREHIVELIEQLKQQVVQSRKAMSANNSKDSDIAQNTRRMLTDSFCNTLVKSTCCVFPRLTSILDNQYIDTKDATIICMHLATFPNAVIRDYMGVERDHSVTNKKRELARKLNLKSLDNIKQTDNN